MGKSKHLTDKIWLHKLRDSFSFYLHWGRTTWHYEGYLGKNANHNSIGLKLGGEENDVMIHMGIKRLFNFYLGVENILPRKMMNKLFEYDGRHYGISLFEEYISIEFHRDDMGYSKGWRGYHKMIDWKRILFGKEKYEEKNLETVTRFIELPEGKYKATVKKFESTWARKRFLKPKTLLRFDITPNIPIPEPGKGENGWDLDDDALVSGTYAAESVDDALKQVAESVMKTRRNRAGEDWIPQKGWEVL